MSAEYLDNAKAWTCVSHILHTLGAGKHIDTSEGYLLTVDDRIFWQATYKSMSNYHPTPSAAPEEHGRESDNP